jgi:hypothetical protein
MRSIFYMVDSLTNVSLSDAEGQSGHLLISQKRFRQREEKRGLDKEKPHEPLVSFQASNVSFIPHFSHLSSLLR